MHNIYPQTSGTSTLNIDSSRLPPRTRPIVALPPSKLEPVLDVDSSSVVYEDAFCELGENKHHKNSQSNAPKQHDAKNVELLNDSVNATRSNEIPGNRPPMWRQRGHDNSEPHNHHHHHNKSDDGSHSREKSKSLPRHRSETAATDSRLLPSKLSFKGSRHHRSESHCTNRSRSCRNVYNSLDSVSTGSSRPYDSKYTNSSDYNSYGETQYSDYPDASQMHPDDIFYPPGGSFHPYQAKYEPGYYKSSSTSGYHRAKHPPSPPVRDEPLRPEVSSKSTTEEHKFPHEERSHRRSHNGFTNRSSSLQNLSQCEEQDKSVIRRRLARSASAHRKYDSEERRSFSRSRNHRSTGCSSASSLSIDNTGSYIPDYVQPRGRSDRRDPSEIKEQADSMYYDSNHNPSKRKEKNTSQRKASNCSSLESNNTSYDRHRSHTTSHSSEARTRSKDTDHHRQVSHTVLEMI